MIFNLKYYIIMSFIHRAFVTFVLLFLRSAGELPVCSSLTSPGADSSERSKVSAHFHGIRLGRHSSRRAAITPSFLIIKKASEDFTLLTPKQCLERTFIIQEKMIRENKNRLCCCEFNFI